MGWPEVTIGPCRLICGDALEVVTSLPVMEAVITDPPYASGARRDAERQVRGAMLRSLEDDDWFSHDAMTSWGYGWFFRGLLLALRSHLCQGAHLYIFSDWRQTPNIYALLESSGYRVNHCLVWAKTHYGMGVYWRNQHENIVFGSTGMPKPMLAQNRGSVLTVSAVASQARCHPTEKPLELLKRIIEPMPGAQILDPFMGSGTTGVACLQLGRSFIGIELDQRYFDIACRRIEHAYAQMPLFPAAQPQPARQEQLALLGTSHG